MLWEDYNMALFDFLFGSSNPAPVETTNISKTEIPAYIAQPTAEMIAAAQDVASEGYMPYGSQRLMGLSADEQTAIKQAQDMSGISTLQGQQAFDAAADSQQAITTGAGGDIDKYMTDYQSNVADIAAQRMRDQSAIEQQGIAKQAVGAGGLDSSRFAILEAERQKNLNQGIGDLYAKSQANAYTTALGAAQSEQERAQKGAAGMTLASQGQQSLTQGDIGTQLGIGSLQRGQDQKALDIGYGDFLQEQNKPKEQLGFLSNIIQGAPFATTTTNTGIAPGQQRAPIFSQLLGGAGSILGAGSKLNLFGGP